MTPSLSIVINTKNAAATLERCLYSVKPIAAEIIVMDMNSSDATLEIAEKFAAKIYHHDDAGYADPARNAALAKATKDWILVIDADEELPEALQQKIPQLLDEESINGYSLPRQNLIFGQVASAGWWPDYQLRLFRRGQAHWPAEVHSLAQVTGKTVYLPAKPENAFVHYNYASIDEYIDRGQRYASYIAEQFREENVPDPLETFFGELLTRYYAWEGFHAGRHGEYLSVLQSCTKVIEAAKVWERKGFPERKKNPKLSTILARVAGDARWWEAKLRREKSHGLARLYWRLRMALRQ
jgi:glycosyltransferase involved in cell wall biosynthesis